MKVIKEPNREWSYRFTCRECQAELEAEAADVAMSRSEDGLHYYVTCPCCDTGNPVDGMNLPILVRQQIVRNHDQS